MGKYRLKCPNLKCKYEGLMEGTEERSVVKQHFLDKQKAKQAAAGTVAAPVQMTIRCPKCRTRFRTRSNPVH